ncbi:ubiquinone biosynthesis O-methyltransferase, mitochondrial isoform X1 [Brachyhypopomus gauderio]|uniref:ubiquinone biosynthesis O-methyltransferase, mitochondrial isoform X1 n=1 Tax=Brachyhypopomus gauderio TaxID=698409 RepID=UPI0040434EDC
MAPVSVSEMSDVDVDGASARPKSVRERECDEGRQVVMEVVSDVAMDKIESRLKRLEDRDREKAGETEINNALQRIEQRMDESLSLSAPTRFEQTLNRAEKVVCDVEKAIRQEEAKLEKERARQQKKCAADDKRRNRGAPDCRDTLIVTGENLEWEAENDEGGANRRVKTPSSEESEVGDECINLSESEEWVRVPAYYDRHGVVTRSKAKNMSTPGGHYPIMAVPGSSYAHTYAPWTHRDLHTMIDKLPNPKKGIQYFLSKFEQYTAGDMLGLGDIRTLFKAMGVLSMLSTAEKAAGTEHLADEAPFGRIRSALWGQLRLQNQDTFDTAALSGVKPKEDEDPMSYLDRCKEIWQAKTGVRYDKSIPVRAMYRTAVVASLSEGVQTKLKDVVALDQKEDSEWEAAITHHMKREAEKGGNTDKLMKDALLKLLRERDNSKPKKQLVSKEDTSVQAVAVEPPAQPVMQPIQPMMQPYVMPQQVNSWAVPQQPGYYAQAGPYRGRGRAKGKRRRRPGITQGEGEARGLGKDQGAQEEVERATVDRPVGGRRCQRALSESEERQR